LPGPDHLTATSFFCLRGHVRPVLDALEPPANLEGISASPDLTKTILCISLDRLLTERLCCNDSVPHASQKFGPPYHSKTSSLSQTRIRLPNLDTILEVEQLPCGNDSGGPSLAGQTDSGAQRGLSKRTLPPEMGRGRWTRRRQQVRQMCLSLTGPPSIFVRPESLRACDGGCPLGGDSASTVPSSGALCSFGPSRPL